MSETPEAAGKREPQRAEAGQDASAEAAPEHPDVARAIEEAGGSGLLLMGKHFNCLTTEITTHF